MINLAPLKFSAALFVLAASACGQGTQSAGALPSDGSSGEADSDCTTTAHEAAPAVEVRIRNQVQDGRCMVDVRAQLGGQDVILECSIENFDCVCRGGEDPGHYIIDAHFVDTWLTREATVAATECGVETEQIVY